MFLQKSLMKKFFISIFILLFTLPLKSVDFNDLVLAIQADNYELFVKYLEKDPFLAEDNDCLNNHINNSEKIQKKEKWLKIVVKFKDVLEQEVLYTSGDFKWCILL